MSSVSSKKLEKSSVGASVNITNTSTHSIKINLKFTIYPEEQREEYVRVINRLIKRAERIVNSHAKGMTTKLRLRAMTVITDLIRASYVMVRDVEIQEYEQEIEELEREEEIPYTVEEPT